MHDASSHTPVCPDTAHGTGKCYPRAAHSTARHAIIRCAKRADDMASSVQAAHRADEPAAACRHRPLSTPQRSLHLPPAPATPELSTAHRPRRHSLARSTGRAASSEIALPPACGHSRIHSAVPGMVCAARRSIADMGWEGSCMGGSAEGTVYALGR
eukprot:1376901-Rhodomonas_salina.1